MSVETRRVPRRALLRYALIVLAVLSVVLANVMLQRANAVGSTDHQVAAEAVTARSR